MDYNITFNFSDINLILFNEIFKEINNSDVDGYKSISYYIYFLHAYKGL